MNKPTLSNPFAAYHHQDVLTLLTCVYADLCGSGFGPVVKLIEQYTEELHAKNVFSYQKPSDFMAHVMEFISDTAKEEDKAFDSSVFFREDSGGFGLEILLLKTIQRMTSIEIERLNKFLEDYPLEEEAEAA